MGLKLEVGKYYKTRDGRKVGPMLIWNDRAQYPWSDDMKNGTDVWTPSGISYSNAEGPTDLIAEWTDAPTGPVRTVTRKEIVPGVYGDVVVGDDHGIFIPDAMHTAAELRAAIATLTEIADALEDQ